MSDYFIFDNIDTRNYEGISVYFDEVDTTPKRVGEFIEIPNRNGALFLDSGRYEDVTHTYDIIALSFQNGRNLINALASKVGHHRLEDSFNTGEYYSAVFDTEVLPTATTERDKFSFKVRFTRKPQRFLTSGETEVTVANNGTLTNPTLFDASPLLEVKGYGNIGIGGETINIDNALLGNVTLLSSSVVAGRQTVEKAIDYSMLNAGDTITIDTAFKCTASWTLYTTKTLASVTVTDNGSSDFDYNVTHSKVSDGYSLTCGVVLDSAKTLLNGNNLNLTSIVITMVANFTDSTTTTRKLGVYFNLSTTGSQRLTIQLSENANSASLQTVLPNITAYSTQTGRGNPSYIDLDVGEAYKIEGGSVISLNDIISIGADLPVLVPGANTITYDNTITDLKVIPRWWKV